MLRLLSLFLLGAALGHSYRIDDWLTKFSAEEGNENKAAEGKIWVVLVAGSNGWYNYRHQSDVCHIYQLLVRNHAIPRTNIVTMMYNDIAYNRDNPTPGTIINALHASDVYEGVMIDYMGEDVNPKIFLDVLAGKYVSKGSRKVVKSTKDDIIFVNFVDHGGPGILAFPSGELHKADLDSTMNQMFEGARYKQMLMYIEACYSGSMFSKMSDKMGITAHTAANADESSYACVMDDDLNTYLGDCWSLNWMNNTETIAPGWNKETVGQQYQIVKKMTTQSHAMLYGDLTTIPNEPLSTFLGTPGEKRWKMEMGQPREMKSIQSQDVMVDWLRRKLAKENDDEAAEELRQQIKFHEDKERYVEKAINAIAEDVLGAVDAVSSLKQVPLVINHAECNKNILTGFFSACHTRIQDHPYITKYLNTLAKLCNVYSEDHILASVARFCNAN